MRKIISPTRLRSFNHAVLFLMAWGSSYVCYGQQLNITQPNDLTTPFLSRNKLGLKGCVKSINQNWIFGPDKTYNTKYGFNRYGNLTAALTSDDSFIVYNYTGELLGYIAFPGEHKTLAKYVTETSIEKKDKSDRPTLLISQTRERDRLLLKGTGTKVMQIIYKGSQAVERKILEKRDGVEIYRIWTEVFIKNEVDEVEAAKIAGIDLIGDPQIPSYVGMSVYGPSGLVVEKNGAFVKIFTYDGGLLQKQTISSNNNSTVHLLYKNYKFDTEGNWLSREVKSDEEPDDKLTKEVREIEYYWLCN